AERDPDRDAALLRGVDHVAREGRPAADDLVARVEDRLRQAVDETVRARTDRDLLEADAEALGERAAQLPGSSVRVAVQVGDAALERLERRRKRPERPLVRRELDTALEPELALHLLDRLAGLVRHEVANRRPEEAVCDPSDGGGHGVDCSRLLFPSLAGNRPLPAGARAAPERARPAAHLRGSLQGADLGMP